MTEESDSASTETSFASEMVVQDFFEIEAMNEFYAENGCCADYRQIEPGPLHIQLLALELGRIVLYRERINRVLESTATSHEGAYSFVVALSDSPFRVGGATADRDHIVLIPPNTRLEIASASETDALTIQIPVDLFHEYYAAFGELGSFADIKQITLKSTPSMDVDKFRQMIAGIFADQPEFRTRRNMERTLIDALTDILDGRTPVSNGHDPYSRLEKHRIVLRSKEYIHSHLTETIRMGELCDYCSVSLSTLERVFKRELNICPKAYILATRLHEVRRMLRVEENDTLTIAEIAMNGGFAHMGRFSRRYRAHFGRLPSEDRLRANGL